MTKKSKILTSKNVLLVWEEVNGAGAQLYHVEADATDWVMLCKARGTWLNGISNIGTEYVRLAIAKSDDKEYLKEHIESLNGEFAKYGVNGFNILGKWSDKKISPATAVHSEKAMSVFLVGEVL